MEPLFAQQHAGASDDATRLRVVVDQVASLTDPSASAWLHRLS
jgi:dGTPase